MTHLWLDLSILQTQDRSPILRALDAFRQYADSARTVFVEPRRTRIQKVLEKKPHPMLKFIDYGGILGSVDEAILSNSKIAQGIFQVACSKLAWVLEEVKTPHVWQGTATEFDCSLARSCIRAMFRDWSQEGTSERDMAHGPILDALRTEFDSRPDKGKYRVLVPGAGLARLTYSISQLGLSVEGNDISYHTLLACMYLFTDGKEEVPQALYPWALSFSNHISRGHQFQKVIVPDVQLSHRILFAELHETHAGRGFVMADGGFVSRYGGPGTANEFSALVTCYFIDTAPNLLEYVDTAWNCLAEGGIWVNIGPLLWNIEENGPAGNGEGDPDVQESWTPREADTSLLELTVDEVLSILRRKGFKLETESSNVGASTYIGNRSSMLQYTYNMAFWVVRKCTKPHL